MKVPIYYSSRDADGAIHLHDKDGRRISIIYPAPQDIKEGQGIPGEQGPVGLQGSQGIQGETGATGPQGPQGIQGIQGEPGAKGDTGDAGPKGDKGDTGEQGAPGEAGIQGEPGAQGAKGDKGDQGNLGADGAQGEQGIQGLPGADGNQGPQGYQGPAGDTGPKGDKGDKGDAGDPLSVSAAYPVGSVYLSILATNPATLLGIGIWIRIASGRMLVGQNDADADFDVAEETGGAKTHTHADHPALSHTGGAVDAHSGAGVNTHSGATVSDHAIKNTAAADVGATKIGTTTSTATLKAHVHSIGAYVHTVGQAAAHVFTQAVNHVFTQPDQHAAQGHDTPNSMNPYFVIYIWKRTA